MSVYKSLVKLNNIVLGTTTMGAMALMTAWGVSQAEEAQSCYEDLKGNVHVTTKMGNRNLGLNSAWVVSDDGTKCHERGNPSNTIEYKEPLAPKLK